MTTAHTPGTEPAAERLLKPHEVAELFRVDPKTVTRWSAAGRLNFVLTPGGHHRFRESEVQQLLKSQRAETTPISQRRARESGAVTVADIEKMVADADGS